MLTQVWDRIQEKLDARRSLSAAGKIERDQPDDTPASESAIVEMVERFKRDSEQSAGRRKGVQWWQEADRIISGEHWDADGDFSEYQSNHTINKVFPKREKMASILIERLGQVEILPRMANETLIAENVDNFWRHEFERNNWIFPLSVCAKKAIDHNISWIKVFWDVHGDGGRGAVKLEPVSNYDLYLHDGAQIREGVLVTKYAIHVFEKTREEILSIYGVDPDGELEDRDGIGAYPTPQQARMHQGMAGLSTRNELGIGQTRPVGASVSHKVSHDSPNRQQRRKTYQVMECWYQDDSRVEGPEYDNVGAGGVPPLRYPHGRIISIANGRKLFDSPNPLGFFPGFVPLPVTADPERLYIPSTVNQAADPQMELNKRRSQITDHTELCSNPILVYSHLSQIQQDTDITAPGTRIMTYDTVNRDKGISWLAPPPLASDVYASAQASEQDLDEIMGVHEVNRGEAPSHARSGVAIERLQMEGMTRSNMGSRFFDQGLKTLVRYVLTCYLDYTSDSRQFRYTDPSTMQVQFGEFNPDAMVLPKKEEAIAAIQEQIQAYQYQLAVAIQQGMPEAEDLAPYIESEVERLGYELQSIHELPTHELISFDIRISTGSRNLTASGQASMAMELFQLGAINTYTLLKTLDFPGWQGALKMQLEDQHQQLQAEQAHQEEGVEDELTVQDDQQAHELEMQTREFAHEREIQKMKIAEATRKADAQRRQRVTPQRRT